MAKIGASLSLFTAAISLAPATPTVCWIWPETPDAEVQVGGGLGAGEADDAVLAEPLEVGEALGAAHDGAQRGRELVAEGEILAGVEAAADADDQRCGVEIDVVALLGAPVDDLHLRARR